MINPFFKNIGPFGIKNILKLNNISNPDGYDNFDVSNINDLITAKEISHTYYQIVVDQL